MGKRVLPFLAILMAIIALRLVAVGDLGIIDSLLLARHSARPFDAVAWGSQDPVVRGEMLRDLARDHRFKGEQVSAVTALLGPSECYINYDDEPCYRVQVGADKYRLKFSVNHSGEIGKVHSVSIGK